MQAAFFRSPAGKPGRGGRGAPGRKGTPKAGTSPQGCGGRGVATCKPRVAGLAGSRRGKGAARGARPGGARGDGPQLRKGGGWGLRQAAPRAQGASRRRPLGGAAGALAGWPSECRLPPREEMWGPGLGARRAGSRWRGLEDPRPSLPRMLLARLGAPPRGRLRGAAEARARGGLRWPRGWWGGRVS